MMKLAPVFFTLILLTSTLSGCMGNDDEISERDAKITDLESQIEDLNSENENLTSQLETLNGENENLNSLSAEILQMLNDANNTVSELNAHLTANQEEIWNLTAKRDALQAELDYAIETNSTYIAQLESDITSLEGQVNLLQSENLDLTNQLSQANNLIDSLTLSLNALNDRIDALSYELFVDSQGCPLDGPTEKMEIGHDTDGDGTLTGNEVGFVLGECAPGVGRVAEIAPSGDANIANAVVMGDVIYFTADDGVHGNELWRSDGSVGGTWMVVDLTPPPCPTCDNPDTVIEELVAGDTHLFFSSLEIGNFGIPDPISELFVSDGTAAGTHMVTDLFDCPTNPGTVVINYEGVNSLYAIPGSAVGQYGLDRVVFSGFSCSTNDWTCYGEEVWMSDGTEIGTIEVANLRIGDAPLVTPTGSVLVDIIGSQPRDFFRQGTDIFFTADDNITGRELWSFNLLQATMGATQVKDINYGSGDSFDIDTRVEFVSLNGLLLFPSEDGSTGNEVWKTDGTSIGTQIVRNIAENENSSNPRELSVIGDMVYFSADDGIHGRELWRTNGVYFETELVLDIVSGSGNGNPKHMTEFADGFYLSAMGWDSWEGTFKQMPMYYDGNLSEIESGIMYESENTGKPLAVLGDELYFTGVWMEDYCILSVYYNYDSEEADIWPEYCGQGDIPFEFVILNDYTFYISMDYEPGYLHYYKPWVNSTIIHWE